MISNKLTTHTTSSGDQYSVGNTGHTLELQQYLKGQGQPKSPNYVLVQLQNEREHTRVRMTPEKAREMAKMLIENAQIIES